MFEECDLGGAPKLNNTAIAGPTEVGSLRDNVTTNRSATLKAATAATEQMAAGLSTIERSRRPPLPRFRGHRGRALDCAGWSWQVLAFARARHVSIRRVPAAHDNAVLEAFDAH